MKGNMTIHYDEEGDFLEISFGKPSKCYAIQIQPGIILRMDEKSEEIKSIDIIGFKKRTKNLKGISFKLPSKIELS